MRLQRPDNCISQSLRRGYLLHPGRCCRIVWPSQPCEFCRPNAFLLAKKPLLTSGFSFHSRIALKLSLCPTTGKIMSRQGRTVVAKWRLPTKEAVRAIMDRGPSLLLPSQTLVPHAMRIIWVFGINLPSKFTFQLIDIPIARFKRGSVWGVDRRQS